MERLPVDQEYVRQQRGDGSYYWRGIVGPLRSFAEVSKLKLWQKHGPNSQSNMAIFEKLEILDTISISLNPTMTGAYRYVQAR